MLGEKMFWEVWRNVTSATNNWSLGGNNGVSKKGPITKSAQRTRYNRLRSGPTKSISQPADLTMLAGFSSTESLEENMNEYENVPKEEFKLESGKPSGRSSNSNRHHHNNSSASLMKHSISSFFPFTSCASSSSGKTGPSSSSPSSSPETSLPVPGKSSSAARIMEEEQQKESPQGNNNGGSGILSSMFSGGGNITNNVGVQLRSPDSTLENSSWDQKQHHQSEKEVVASIVEQTLCEEDEISDIDSEVERLTCDVCERCFPTLKMLAAHQRKKRHYGCLQCDSLFPSREVLEYHREQMCHYDYAIDYYEEEEDGGGEILESEDDENGIKEENCDDEEKERLL